MFDAVAVRAKAKQIVNCRLVPIIHVLEWSCVVDVENRVTEMSTVDFVPIG